MKASAERIEGCQVVLNVEAEPEEMEKSLKSAYHRLVNRVEIPGFRKGKAPQPILERHIGRKTLVGEALEELVPELYKKAVEGQEINPIGQPKMEMIQLDPAIFKAIVPVQPVVELGDYRSINVTPEEVKVTDEDIDEALENLRHKQALWEPVEREGRYDDLATMDVKGTIEGQTVFDNKGRAYVLSHDSTSPVPGFADQVVGMRCGEEKKFSLTIPDDFPNQNLQGKECLFEVSVSEIKEEKLPELSEEFAKSEGIGTVLELREMVTDRLRKSGELQARQKVEGQVIEQAVGLSRVEFPAVLVDREAEFIIQNQLIRLGGMRLEDFLKIKGSTEEKLRDELRPMAGKRVANLLVLNKVSEEEKIEVSDSDIDAEIERRMQETEENEWIQRSWNSQEWRDRIHTELRMRTTMDRLVEIATSRGSSEPVEHQTEE